MGFKDICWLDTKDICHICIWQAFLVGKKGVDLAWEWYAVPTPPTLMWAREWVNHRNRNIVNSSGNYTFHSTFILYNVFGWAHRDVPWI